MNNVGKILRFVPDVWLDHACCVVIMHENDTVERPEFAQSVVNSVADAQLYIRNNRPDAAQLLSADGEGYLPQPLAAIDRALTHYDLAEYEPTGAITHPDWDTDRIDFQPFPFQSYTEELVRQMKQTVVEGDATFLADLDPAQVHREMITDQFARAAIDRLGGPAQFDLAPDLTRTERIAI